MAEFFSLQKNKIYFKILKNPVFPLFIYWYFLQRKRFSMSQRHHYVQLTKSNKPKGAIGYGVCLKILFSSFVYIPYDIKSFQLVYTIKKILLLLFFKKL